MSETNIIYQIVIYGKHGSTKAESYDNLESCIKKVEKSYKRNVTKIVKLPTKVEVGLKLYLCKDHSLYGTIVGENGSFWLVNRAFKNDKHDIQEFIKVDFDNKFIGGIFEVFEEELTEVNK